MPNANTLRRVAWMGLLITAACSSEKPETQQRIVDVYESWSAELRPASCPRYYGFPNCPDLNDYKSEIDSQCNSLSSTSAADLNKLLDEGWRIQSNASHNAESDVNMRDGLVLDTICKGQRYIMTRTCVTKINLLGQETHDPKCVPLETSQPAADAPVQDANGNTENARDALLKADAALAAADEPEAIDAKLIPGIWRYDGHECVGFGAVVWKSDGELFTEGLDGRWQLKGNQLTWSYREYEMGDDEGAATAPLKVQTGTVDSVSSDQLVVTWNGKEGTQRYYRCPDEAE
jgi:hypothetical protein